VAHGLHEQSCTVHHSDPLRRRLLAGRALAMVGPGALWRPALAKSATVDLPIDDGRPQLVAYPENRPLIAASAKQRHAITIDRIGCVDTPR
jgi:hypothetical protein